MKRLCLIILNAKVCNLHSYSKGYSIYRKQEGYVASVLAHWRRYLFQTERIFQFPEGTGSSNGMNAEMACFTRSVVVIMATVFGILPKVIPGLLHEKVLYGESGSYKKVSLSSPANLNLSPSEAMSDQVAGAWDTSQESPDMEDWETLARPIKAVEEKWKLLPHFIRMRGLMRQHIDSFDHFINVDIKEIVAARSNQEIRSEADPRFFLRYTDIYVGEPSLDEQSFVTSSITPFQCRLRDCTYSSPLYVNVRYTRQRQIVTKNQLQIGRIPIMLRSSKCVLKGKTQDQLAEMKECEYDPGGYFIVKGNEKVILMHEQLSKVCS